MNRTLSSYLANVASAAEFAPFGTPGLYQANYFFNNSLVWAASSVASAKKAFDKSPTDENDERIMKATIRLHTIKALYDEYSESVAIPKLEEPHVQKFLGIDKEPDVTQIKAQADTAARTAYRNALLTGRPTAGLYAKEYALKTIAMSKDRETRREMLQEVFSLVHTQADPLIHANTHPDLYDSVNIDTFTEKMHDVFMAIARANWLYATHALSDVSLQTFNPSKYTRLEATRLGCRAFMKEFGVTDEALKDWTGKLNAAVNAESVAFQATEQELDASVEAEAQAFADAQAVESAEAQADKLKARLVKGDNRAAREAGIAAQARAEEDKIAKHREALVRNISTAKAGVTLLHKEGLKETKALLKDRAKAATLVEQAKEMLRLHDEQHCLTS